MEREDYNKQLEDADDLAVIAERREEGTIPHAELVDIECRDRIWAELDADAW